MAVFPTRILVGVERSRASDLAVDVAAELSRATGSELHLVHVKIIAGTIASRPVSSASQERLTDEGEALLADVRRRIEEGGGEVAGTHVRGGTSIDRALVHAQEELGAGLLVVGASGTGAVAQRLAGGISTGTVRKAPGSVLVVRP
jgi:nucleotide-binding universal stress UspA family protein